MFGTLAGFAFTWALLADLFFAPALIVLLKPLGPER
jgi:predicted RND superfamily exporter protein